MPTLCAQGIFNEARKVRKTSKYITMIIFIHVMIEEQQTALPGVTQWSACRPAIQMVTASIPSQGTCLGCRPGPN